MEDEREETTQESNESETINIDDVIAERDSFKEENDRLKADLEKVKSDLKEAKQLNFTMARSINSKPDESIESMLDKMFTRK